MGFFYDDVCIKMERVTKPIIERLKKQDKYDLIDINNFTIDQDNIPYIIKRNIFTKKEKKYRVLFLVDQPLLSYLLNLWREYNISLMLPVRPYCLWTRAAILEGPTLEQIFNKKLYKQKLVQSTFKITNDKTGEELAKIEFQFEYKDNKFIIHMEKMEKDFPTTRYIHCIMNAKKEIIHIDSSRFYYEENYKNRIKKKYEFDKEVKKEKVFRIDGVLDKKEIIQIGKKYFEIYCKYLKLTKE